MARPPDDRLVLPGTPSAAHRAIAPPRTAPSRHRASRHRAIAHRAIAHTPGASDDATSAPRLLVVEDDAELGDLWTSVLTEGGYRSQVVATLGEALLLAAVETFDLVLINLAVRTTAHQLSPLSPASALRRRVAPTPVGLLTTDLRLAERAFADPAHPTPFAFVQVPPFALDAFLTSVAAALDQPFRPARRWQKDLVIQFLEALANDDWSAAPALLCTEGVALHPPEGSPVRRWAEASPPMIYGREAFVAARRAALARARHLSCFNVHCYPLPHGAAARFTASYETSEGERRRETAALLFRFAHGRINRIGAPADYLSFAVSQDAGSQASGQ